jgi:hypothetical protein
MKSHIAILIIYEISDLGATGVMLLVYRFEAFSSHMGVNLGGRDIRVPQ